MTTLIIGGHGKTGRLVTQKLTALGHPVRPASRSTDPAFDWQDESTWPAVIDGAESAYITYHPDIALPGAAEQIGAFARAAVARGCRRLVLLSGRGEDGARRAEEALTASDADWTIVRSAFFMQNFTEGIWAEGIAHGSFTMLTGSAPEPFIDTDDVASVAVAALTDREHVGLVHDLTGPRLFTFHEAVDEISATGPRQIEYRELPADGFIATLQDAGLSAEEAGGLAALFGEVLDGRNAHTTDTVHRVLGRPPRELHDLFVNAHGVADDEERARRGERV